MADTKISAFPNGDAQITGAQGRVDVPVTIGSTTYQVDGAVLAELLPPGTNPNDVPFASGTGNGLMVANGDLQFVSDSEGAAGSSLQVNAVTDFADITVNAPAEAANISVFGNANARAGSYIAVVDSVKYGAISATGIQGGHFAAGYNPLASESVAPVIGTGIYPIKTAGRPTWRVKDSVPTLHYALQPSWWDNMVYIWRAGPGTAGTSLGFQNVTGSGTFLYVVASGTSSRYTTNRGTYASVVTTTNQNLGVNTGAQFVRGTGNGIGGYFFYARFGFEKYIAGDRLFVGLNGLCSSDPSSQANIVGFAMDAADSAITFMHNDNVGTATKDAIAGQPTVATGQGYDAYIYADPNDNSKVYYRLDDLNAKTTIIDTSTAADLPLSGTFVSARCHMGNAANIVAGDANLGLMTFYVEVPN